MGGLRKGLLVFLGLAGTAVAAPVGVQDPASGTLAGSLVGIGLLAIGLVRRCLYRGENSPLRFRSNSDRGSVTIAR
jgi:hypothetical protein